MFLRCFTFLQALDYNVPGGKFNRGMAVADVYQALREGKVSFLVKVSDFDTLHNADRYWHLI